LSIDVEYNRFTGETVDTHFRRGIFINGETDLENWATEGGFMVLPKKLEIVRSYEDRDATNYSDTWTRLSFGINWLI